MDVVSAPRRDRRRLVGLIRCRSPRHDPLTSLILARLLSPTDSSLIAMALAFIGFVELVRDLGRLG